MSVHYKFKSAIDFDTINFDGLHISVADLKKAIFQQKRIGRASEFDMQIVNAQTKEVYNNDEMLIPKNTSVIISRIPVGGVSANSVTGGTITTNLTAPPKRRDRNNQPDAVNILTGDTSTANSAINFESLAKSSDAPDNASEEEKIKAMMKQAGHEYDPSKYEYIRNNRGMNGPTPSNYTCFRCGKPGHWIKNCPQIGSSAPPPMELKRSTGIPRSFMINVDGPEHRGALLTSSGHYAVPLIDHNAYRDVKKEKPPFVAKNSDEEEGKEKPPPPPEELLCMMCKDLLQDAVLIPCCGNSFCDDCIRSELLDSEQHECPVCHELDQSPNNLIPNRFLRTAVHNFRNKTGYTRAPVVKIEAKPTSPAEKSEPKREVETPPPQRRGSNDQPEVGGGNDVTKELSAEERAVIEREVAAGLRSPPPDSRDDDVDSVASGDLITSPHDEQPTGHGISTITTRVVTHHHRRMDDSPPRRRRSPSPPLQRRNNFRADRSPPQRKFDRFGDHHRRDSPTPNHQRVPPPAAGTYGAHFDLNVPPPTTGVGAVPVVPPPFITGPPPTAAVIPPSAVVVSIPPPSLNQFPSQPPPPGVTPVSLAGPPPTHFPPPFPPLLSGPPPNILAGPPPPLLDKRGVPVPGQMPGLLPTPIGDAGMVGLVGTTGPPPPPILAREDPLDEFERHLELRRNRRRHNHRSRSPRSRSRSRSPLPLSPRSLAQRRSPTSLSPPPPGARSRDYLPGLHRGALSPSHFPHSHGFPPSHHRHHHHPSLMRRSPPSPLSPPHSHDMVSGPMILHRGRSRSRSPPFRHFSPRRRQFSRSPPPVIFRGGRSPSPGYPGGGRFRSRSPPPHHRFMRSPPRGHDYPTRPLSPHRFVGRMPPSPPMAMYGRPPPMGEFRGVRRGSPERRRSPSPASFRSRRISPPVMRVRTAHSRSKSRSRSLERRSRSPPPPTRRSRSPISQRSKRTKDIKSVASEPKIIKLKKEKKVKAKSVSDDEEVDVVGDDGGNVSPKKKKHRKEKNPSGEHKKKKKIKKVKKDAAPAEIATSAVDTEAAAVVHKTIVEDPIPTGQPIQVLVGQVITEKPAESRNNNLVQVKLHEELGTQKTTLGADNGGGDIDVMTVDEPNGGRVDKDDDASSQLEEGELVEDLPPPVVDSKNKKKTSSMEAASASDPVLAPSKWDKMSDEESDVAANVVKPTRMKSSHHKAPSASLPDEVLQKAENALLNKKSIKPQQDMREKLSKTEKDRSSSPSSHSDSNAKKDKKKERKRIEPPSPPHSAEKPPKSVKSRLGSTAVVVNNKPARIDLPESDLRHMMLERDLRALEERERRLRREEEDLRRREEEERLRRRREEEELEKRRREEEEMIIRRHREIEVAEAAARRRRREEDESRRRREEEVLAARLRREEELRRRAPRPKEWYRDRASREPRRRTPERERKPLPTSGLAEKSSRSSKDVSSRPAARRSSPPPPSSESSSSRVKKPVSAPPKKLREPSPEPPPPGTTGLGQLATADPADEFQFEPDYDAMDDEDQTTVNKAKSGGGGAIMASKKRKKEVTPDSSSDAAEDSSSSDDSDSEEEQRKRKKKAKKEKKKKKDKKNKHKKKRKKASV